MRIVKLILIFAVISIYGMKAELAEFDASNFIVTNNKSALVQADNNGYNFNLLNTKAEEIFRSGKNHIEIKNFPIRPGYNVNLILSKQTSAFSKDIEITHFKDGKPVKLERKENGMYYGFIEGESHSDVFMTYSSLGLMGFIQNENDQMYNISADMTKLGKEIIVQNIATTSMEDFLKKNKLQMCASDEVEDFRPEEIDLNDKKLNNEVQSKNDLYEVKMAVDMNFEFYLMFCQFITGGNPSQWKTGDAWYVNMTDEQLEQARQMSLDYVENVMSAVSRIYTREVAILIKVGYIKLFDDLFNDPYYKVFGEQLGTKLSSMPNIWANRANEAKDRVITTVFTDVRRQTGGNVLGIAMSGLNYGGTLCDKSMGYSALGMTGTVSFPIIPYSQDVEVAAHEFGHNFGCPHTHWCGWPSFGETIIDSCVSRDQADDASCISPSERRIKLNGTIMSYCHIGGRILLNFHPRMKERIRDHTKKALTSCVYIPKEPVVRIIRPLGEEQYFANEKTTIAFQAANVPLSKLMYSSNLGKDWNLIGTVNTASDSTAPWTVPSATGTQYLVRIESATDPNVFDQSILPFTVSDFSISPVSPKNGDKIGYVADQKLTWLKENIKEVNVKYSLDNGKTFTDIVTNKDISSVTYNFPDVESNDAILVVESTNDPSINMTVHFKLGKENVNFTDPMAGDTVNVNFTSKTVKFTTDLINSEFDLYLIINGVDTTKINNFVNKVDLVKNTFNWKIDNSIKAGDTGELEARINNTPVGETGVFLFEAATGVSRTYSPLFTISSLIPNPAKENISIEVNNVYPKLMKTNVKIVGMDGRIYKSVNDKYMVSGKSVMLIDISDLPVGTYSVMIESENNKDVQQLKVVR